MIKKQLPLFLILFLFSQSVFPNAKLFPGYYIDLKGDTVQCNIEFSDWIRSPKTIQVRVNTEKKEFSQNEIRGFGVFGYDDYISAKVSYHTNPIGKYLPENFSDSVETRVCFLKVLQNGYYSLYFLSLPERIYLFMSDPNEKYTELVYRVKEFNYLQTEDPTYKKQILSLFVAEGLSEKYFTRINNVAYTSSDVGSLFRILNENHGIAKIRKKSPGGFQIEAFAGIIMNTFPSEYPAKYVDLKFSPSFSPGGGLNFLYSIPGKFSAFKFGLAFGYNSFNCKFNHSGTYVFYSSANYNFTTNYNETLTFKTSILLTNIYVEYLINPQSKLKFYLKGGLNYNLLLSNDPYIYISDSSSSTGVRNGNIPTGGTSKEENQKFLKLRTKYPSILTAAGIVKGRNKLEFCYSPNVGIGDLFAYQFKVGYVALYYYLSLFPGKVSHP